MRLKRWVWHKKCGKVHACVAQLGTAVLDIAGLKHYNCMMTQMSKRRNGKDLRCCPDLARLLEARFFKAMCDPCRIGILIQLAESCAPRTVTDIAGCCTPDMSVVSRHLATLRDAGVLHAEKRGKEVFYRVRYGELAATLRAIADAIETCCPIKKD
jgi:ArsR family transcriptional regulator